MQHKAVSHTASIPNFAIEDFELLQARYKSLGLAARAQMVMADAAPVLQAADQLLAKLSANKHLKHTLTNIRKNLLLAGKMRASGARNSLLDPSCDIIADTQRKMAAWNKTMQRISQGESISKKEGREYIPDSAPLALAVIGSSGISGYLSMVQLILMELGKIDSRHASHYSAMTTDLRRYATLLGDFEITAGIIASVH